MSAYLAMYLFSNILIKSNQCNGFIIFYPVCLSVFVDKMVQCLFRQLITLSLSTIRIFTPCWNYGLTDDIYRYNLFQHFVIYDERE